MPLLERLHAMSSQLALSVTIGFSREMLDAYDAGELDAVVVRQEGSRRGGEKLTEDEFGWFAAKRLAWRRGETLPLATLAPPCGVRALAIRALDKAGIAWSERFVGGGVTAVAAAALAGLAVAPLARRIAPPGLVDIGPAEGLPRLGILEGDAALEGQRSRQAARHCGRWRRRSGAWLARRNGPFRRRNGPFR